MKMPMMEVLKEDAELESAPDSERNNLAIPAKNKEAITEIRRKSILVTEVNIPLPHEIPSHKSQLLDKARQIHDHMLPDR